MFVAKRVRVNADTVARDVEEEAKRRAAEAARLAEVAKEHVVALAAVPPGAAAGGLVRRANGARAEPYVDGARPEVSA